jgi:hypothetical protein
VSISGAPVDDRITAGRLDLDAGVLELLADCDGTRTVRELADGFEDPADCQAAVERLARLGVLRLEK